MKKILIVIAVLLMLPVMAYIGLYAYGTFIVSSMEAKQDAINKEQEKTAKAGNGFGGEAGFVIEDSGYYSDKYFWIDNDHLVFMKKPGAESDFINFENYVWDLKSNAIKKINMSGGISCYRDGQLYHFYNSEPFSKDKKKTLKIYRSLLLERNNQWELGSSEDIKRIWPLPSERYTLEWTEQCKPWFRLKTDKRTPDDVPEHRFEYLPEWGWIIRMPRVGPEYYDQTNPEVGVFDIDNKLYAGQQGKKISSLPEVAAKYLPNIEITYLPFLEKFWFSSWIFTQEDAPKYMALLDKNGVYTVVDWELPKWKLYDSPPVLSRKGLIWSGYDYRLANISRYEQGGFMKTYDGLHKFIHGHNSHLILSPDGCRLAFVNQPRYDKGKSSLRMFNICESKINNRELEDVIY
jgi:hypothetical protein